MKLNPKQVPFSSFFWRNKLLSIVIATSVSEYVNGNELDKSTKILCDSKLS